MSNINLNFTVQPIAANLYIEGTVPTAGVTGLIAGNNITLTPSSGKGNVTINAINNVVLSGNSGQIQYNNSGNLGAISSISTDGTKLTLNSVSNLQITNGTEGQYLAKLEGNLAWMDVYGTEGSVQFKSGNYIYGVNDFRFDLGTRTLKIGQANSGGRLEIFTSDPFIPNPIVLEFSGGATNFTAPQKAIGNGVDFYFRAGTTTAVGSSEFPTGGGSLYLLGGQGQVGGDLILNGGSGTVAGGDLILSPGFHQSLANVAGNIRLETVGLNLTIPSTGAININGSTGNAGFVLTSNGSNSAPSWQEVTGTGTVTSVSGSGSGLGFTLGGTVTTVGDISLSAPSIEQLRGTLNIGNLANLNLSGGAAQFLTGTGAWTTAPVGSGTVLSVSGNGTGLGFSLSGTVTSAGNITLSTPSVATLRTNLGIGNVANLNLNGNTVQFLNGSGQFVSPGGIGTVTSVTGSGSGLGFSLTGTVTGAGNITLSAPSSATLRNNLGIGNIANINLTGSSSNFLRGDGVFASVPSGAGTVTEVGGTGSGLGFSLSGTVTSTGNLTLAAPSATQLRTSLTIGNIANLNLNGNGAQVLAGNGVFISPSAGSVTSVGGNTAAVTGTSLGITLSGTVTSTGNLTLTAPNVATFRTTANIGNIANLNLNGNTSQVLNGSGVFVPFSATVTEISNVKVATEYLRLDWTGGNVVQPVNGSLIYDALNNFSIVNGIDLQPVSPATEVVQVGQSMNITIILSTSTLPDLSTMPFKIKGTSYAVNYAYYVPGGVTNGLVSVNFAVMRTTSTVYKILGAVTGY